MDGKAFTKIFLDVYKDLRTISKDEQIIKTKSRTPIIYNEAAFEANLENYILQMMGWKVYREYQLYKEKKVPTFEYFGEARKFFENILVNARPEKFLDIELWVEEYQKEYMLELEEHPYVDLFIEAVKSTLSNDPSKIYVSKNDKKYSIGLVNAKNEQNMPNLVIQNIDHLEEILEDFIFNIKNSDSFFKNPLEEMEEREAIMNIFHWTIKNATPLDLECVERFYKKFNNFLMDETFNYYKHKPIKLGEFLGDELYLLRRKSTVAYETPYYLSFMMKDNRIELPTVRMGISNGVAHILATQSSQMEHSIERERELNNVFKRMFPKSKYFREYNPAHLVSLVMTMGFLKGYGIETIRFPDYLPLRYQRFILEGRMNEEEIDNFQHRLTNKFTNNFFRMMEFCEGIEVSSYPVSGNVTELKIGDNVIFQNEFLQKLYLLGYSNALAESFEKLKDI